jgi:hypothetical protein
MCMGTYQCVHGDERKLLVDPDVSSQEEVVGIGWQKPSIFRCLHFSSSQSAKFPCECFVRPVDGLRRFMIMYVGKQSIRK